MLGSNEQLQIRESETIVSRPVGHAAQHSGHVVVDPPEVGRDPREGDDVLADGTRIRPRDDPDQDGLVKVVEGVEGACSMGRFGIIHYARLNQSYLLGRFCRKCTGGTWLGRRSYLCHRTRWQKRTNSFYFIIVLKIK